MKRGINIFILLILVLLCFSSCTRSGRRKVTDRENVQKESVIKSEGKTVVKIQKVNGVYEIPTEINGVPMHFIFDTGAGMISISECSMMLVARPWCAPRRLEQRARVAARIMYS